MAGSRFHVITVLFAVGFSLVVPAISHANPGRARSADMTGLIEQLNSSVADLRKAKGSIDSVSVRWSDVRADLLTRIAEAEKKGDRSTLNRLKVQLSGKYADYLNDVQARIRAGIGFLTDIESVLDQIERSESFNPDNLAQKRKALEQTRQSLIKAVRLLGDDEEARDLLVQASNIKGIADQGANIVSNAPSIDRLHQNIVGRVQVWNAWHQNVGVLRQQTRLRLVSWVVDLIQEGIDAAGLFDMAETDIALDISDPLGGVGIGSSKRPTRVTSQEALLEHLTKGGR